MPNFQNRLLMPTLALLGLGLGPALARPLPPAPPSGIVVHLFGPDSLSSQMLSTAAPSKKAPASAGAAGVNAKAETDAGASAPTPAPSPSWGDVAHTLFVTGDPAQEGPASLSKGKAGR